ncbi:MAG: hypothetical protein QX196_05365 [Methylococcaceae bacterium]|jgi:hypothetical protein
MISARNYAAQAERSLRVVSENNAGRFDRTANYALHLSETIKKAQHFAIPDNGALFDDGLKGLDLERIRLPFEKITVEWFISNPLNDGKNPVPKRLVVASENEELNAISVCGAFAIPSGMWAFNPFELFIKMDSNLPFSIGVGGDVVPLKLDDGREVMIAAAFTQDQFANNVQNGTFSQKEVFASFEDSTQELMGLFEFLEALSCKNVIAEPLEKIDHAKNIRRIRDGKLPIYETRILTIDTGCSSGEKHNRGIGSVDGASIRQHLRRGHIRRHPTAGNIWVNSCVVGSSEIGVIDKSYKVY